jgi:predicted RNA binding protein YcfA (HicA-like mRNA interferase family)
MGNRPVLKPREVAAILEKLGFVEARQRGSHKQFRHSDGRNTTVPFHGSRDISPILITADRERHRPYRRGDAAIQVTASNDSFNRSANQLGFHRHLPVIQLNARPVNSGA